MAKKKAAKKTAKKSTKKTKIAKTTKTGTEKKKRARISQTDVPSYQLSEAIRVPQGIADNYGKEPTRPLRVAQALELSPNSSTFKMLTGAAIAYGISDGGYNATEISITELGKRVVSPMAVGDDAKAKREAIMRPRIVREFLEKYDGSPLPPVQIAKNVLEEMGVPNERSKSTYDLILNNAEYVGVVQIVKGKKYIDLGSEHVSDGLEEDGQDCFPEEDINGDSLAEDLPEPQHSGIQNERLRRVFVAHGKNKGLLSPVQKLLGFGEMKAIISTDRQTVAQPIPDKVMTDMRSCGASIILVDDETRLLDKDNVEEIVVLNPNVLIEIGASMALYGKRFVLLVKRGVKLPSNLQGLSEVRYDGDSLSGEATIGLLEAINDIKNHKLPE